MQYILCITLTMIPAASSVFAQITWDQLGFIYAEERFHRTYQTYVETHGTYIPPMEPDRFPVASDSLLGWHKPSDSFAFQGEIHNWKLASPKDRTDWLRKFGTVQWAYLGNNFFTQLDTVMTPAIRARLQAHFGHPTQTAAEARQGDQPPTDEHSQFEYWLTVNDSIPMIIMDVLGPFDRGIIVATDHRFRHFLYRMRQTLLASATRRARPAPYIDYYYSQHTGEWYVTGYNGSRYFIQKIEPPDLDLGRPVQRISQINI